MVFVIGGHGFVGSGFVRLLQRLEAPHRVIQRDNYHEFVGQSCDVLINANGNSSKLLSRREPATDFNASVQTVMASLHDFKCEKYVLCSTCDVYNDVTDPGLNREDAAIDPRKQSRYGFHKHLAEQLVRYEQPNHLIIRFGGFIGPGLKKNAVYDILHGGPLWLDPESALQFLHTDAAAELVWTLTEAAGAGEVVNVCGAGLVRLRDVLQRVGREVPVQPDSPRVSYQINIEKLQGYCSVPRSEDAVFAYVDEQLAAARGGRE